MEKNRGIRLSDKHGVNPSLALCWLCGRETGEIILPGRLPNDAEAPRAAVWHRAPCDDCAGHMRDGVLFLETVDGTDAGRTGRMIGIRESAVTRMLPDGPLRDQVLRGRVAYLSREAWKHLGFPA